MTTQLRRYTINRGKLDEFVAAWQKSVVPLRERHGFHIEGAWIVRERNEFVWLMRYDGDDWDARDQAYYASPERKGLAPDPAQLIARSGHWFVTPVTRLNPR